MHPVTRIFSFHHLASFSAGSAAVLAGLGLGQAAWADIMRPDDIQAANARAAAKPIVRHELKKETPYLKPQPHSPDWGYSMLVKALPLVLEQLVHPVSRAGRKTGVILLPCRQNGDVMTGLTG